MAVAIFLFLALSSEIPLYDSAEGIIALFIQIDIESMKALVLFQRIPDDGVALPSGVERLLSRILQKSLGFLCARLQIYADGQQYITGGVNLFAAADSADVAVRLADAE